MRLRAPGTLGAHLALAYTLTFVALLGAALASLYVAVGRELERRVDEDLVEDVGELARVWREGGDAAVATEVERETALDGHEETFLMLLDRSGGTLVASDTEFWPDAVPDAAVATRLGDGASRLSTERYAGRDADARAILARIDGTRLVFIAESLDERDELLGLLAIASVGVLAIGLPLASLIVWLIGRRATRGIATVGAAATAIAAGELGRRVDAEGQPAEVRALATAFNAMAARNQKLIGDMRDMTDNVAHDLRSPLTRVRLIAETALSASADGCGWRDTASEIVTECDRLVTLINHALDVSEAEAGVSRSPRARIDLARVAADVVELFDAPAEQRGLALVAELAPTLPIDAERPAIERLVANLVDNAVKFTPSGGGITVRARRDGSEAVLTVEDTGPGIPDDALERVFARYYRGDDSRTEPGCGLGLSYVRAVARTYGGEALARSVDGAGACVTVRLPLAGAHRARIAARARAREDDTALAPAS